VVFTLNAHRSGNTLTLTTEGQATGWTLCLRNIHSVSKCSLATTSATAQGIRVTPEHDSRQFVIVL
jgi:alpha-D-xyloside xylohydrolase